MASCRPAKDNRKLFSGIIREKNPKQQLNNPEVSITLAIHREPAIYHL